MEREEYRGYGAETSSVTLRFGERLANVDRRRFVSILAAFTIGGLALACSQKEDLVEDQSSLVLENLSLYAHDETRQIELDSYEQTLVGFSNRERIYLGIKPMLVDASLVELARIRSNYMASRGEFAHTQSDGQSAFTFLSKIKFPYAIAGENLARNNYPNDQAAIVAFDGLMKSPGHRDNVLDRRFTHFGTGHKMNKEGMHYFTQVFVGQFI